MLMWRGVYFYDVLQIGRQSAIFDFGCALNAVLQFLTASTTLPPRISSFTDFNMSADELPSRKELVEGTREFFASLSSGPH